MIKIINLFSVLSILILLGINIYLFYDRGRIEIKAANSRPILETPSGARLVNGLFDVNAQVSRQKRLLETESNNIWVFENARNSVVHVTTHKVYRDFFTLDLSKIPQGSGTGIILSEDGLLVTNYHVIQGGSEINIQLYDRSVHEAELVGSEPDKDIALLRIKNPPSDLTPAKIGKSSELKVGHKVLAHWKPIWPGSHADGRYR